MSLFSTLSIGAWLLVTGTAAALRGAGFAGFAALMVGLYTLVAVAIAPLAQPTRVWPLFVVLHALAYLHLLLLARPRMRVLWIRALVILPGAYFLCGMMLALPWGIAAALGAHSQVFAWSACLPYLVALFGLRQSLTARRDEVHIPLDGLAVGQLARYRSSAARVARPLRVVQISDPHLGPFMSVERLHSICADAVTAEPDLILLTGDFLTLDSQETAAHLTAALTPLRALAGRTFACRGNHDLETPQLVVEALRENGVRLLIDELAMAKTPWGEVELLGFDFVFKQRAAHVATVAMRHPRQRQVLRLALLHDPGSFRHLPVGTADLVLSGHTHGGQLGLPSLGGQWTVPRLVGMPDHGLWARGRDRLYVHRGNGHYGFPLRLGVPAEQSIIHVHCRLEGPLAGRSGE
jgi:predicted MPP superfamily phosphohydrolase